MTDRLNAYPIKLFKTLFTVGRRNPVLPYCLQECMTQLSTNIVRGYEVRPALFKVHAYSSRNGSVFLIGKLENPLARY